MMRWVGFGLVVLLVLGSALPLLAWGSATHAALAVGIAQEQGRSFGGRYYLLQAAYGAAAPDLAWFASEPLRTNLGNATHYEPGCREVWDLADPHSRIERSFAFGWLSHNDSWAADNFAHNINPLSDPLVAPGYIVARGNALEAQYGVPDYLSDQYVEAAVDLLLDQQMPGLKLGSLLSSAARKRDGRIPDLLVKAYADVPGAGSLNIRSLETTFRAGMITYGAGLARPTGADDAAFAQSMAVYFGVGPVESAQYLAAAKSVCQEPSAHYLGALEATILLVAGGPWP